MNKKEWTVTAVDTPDGWASETDASGDAQAQALLDAELLRREQDAYAEKYRQSTLKWLKEIGKEGKAGMSTMRDPKLRATYTVYGDGTLEIERWEEGA